VDLHDLFERAARHAADYRADVADRPVAAREDVDEVALRFAGTLPEGPTPSGDVLDDLVDAADPGLVGTVGPRYFGFVIGGSLEAATAADIVAAGWDQCAFNAALSPAAMAAEQAAGTWLKELLGLPAAASVGFVTGGQEANTVGLATARHHVLERAGWDVESDGLVGAPHVRVIASAERHGTIDRSLRLLGFGTRSVRQVATDGNGATDMADLERALAEGTGQPTIVCLQAGNVNTGAVDDLRRGSELARAADAWVHVDGAFGLWAAASPSTRHLTDGIELADSWGCDGHKWLNVPYDAGYVFCAHPDTHAAAVSYTAAYLTGSGEGSYRGADLTLSSSRRSRGFATWAAVRQLGRSGVIDVVDRCCALARRFADGLAAGGLEIVNEVVLNQVLVGVDSDDGADRTIEAVQRDGTCWIGGTTWRGRRLLRISVSNHTTTEDDVDRSVAAILAAATG
jgi:glutamate/tyrosine decarboxylase-like PLP-dependent enzyme